MILLVIVVVIVALLLERHSLNLPVRWVNYRLEPSKRVVEPDEEFKLVTTVENATGRKIPFLHMEEAIPDGIILCDEESLSLLRVKGDPLVHQSTMFLRKKERVKYSIRARVPQRGIYYFREAKLHFGDFLGVKQITRKIRQNYGVIVYPRRLKDARLQRVLSGVMGDISVQSFLYDDPILIRGYRDYTGREPMRAISFSQSAKRDEMIVKEYDHTREPVMNIIFDLEYRGEFEHYFHQREAMYSVIRTLCEEMEKKHYSYRIITNLCCSAAGINTVTTIANGGAGGYSYAKIMELLSMSGGTAVCSAVELLSKVFKEHASEKNFLYISQRPEPENEAVLNAFEKRHNVKLTRLYGEDYEESYRQSLADMRTNQAS